MPSFGLRKWTEEEAKQHYTRVSQRTNSQIFESEIWRALILVGLLVIFRKFTNNNEDTLILNMLSILFNFGFFLGFFYFTGIMERKYAARKLKGMNNDKKTNS